MILKLIYGRQIHVYDLKSNESLDHLHQKIRQMFKKLPDHFILSFQDTSFQQEIKTNEQLNLFRSLKNNFKTVKLFIKTEDVQKQKVSKSQELINLQKEEQLYDVTQKIELNKQIEQLTEELTNHIMSPREINNQQQDSKEPHQNLSDTKEFEDLSVSPQNQTIIQPSEQREQPSERELHIKFEESSNPEFISKPEALGGSDEKQNLNTQCQQHENQQIQKQHQNKLEIEQNILPANKSIAVDRDEPKVSDQPEEDFRTHHVKCDMCNIQPIYGFRYKCVLCQDYDLCQKCEEKFSHEHPLLKICYTYQTPIRIAVQIPELKVIKNSQQHQAKMETINLRDMSQQQRSERVLSMASEIAELLDMDIGKCLRFIELNEHYTKEKVIQMLINRKQQKQSKDPGVRHQQENRKIQDLGIFLNTLKKMFSR